MKSFTGMCLLPVGAQPSIPLTVPMSHASCLIPLPPLLFCCWFYEAQKCRVLSSWRLHAMSWPCGYSGSLYVFENGSGVFANKACCLWIVLASFYLFHTVCAVFDALTYMFLLPVSVSGYGKLSNPFVYNVSGLFTLPLHIR